MEKHPEWVLSSIFEAAPLAITITDLEGRVVSFSKATLTTHGFDEGEDITGMLAFDLVASKDHERAAKNLQKTLTEDVIRNVKYTLLRKNGEEFPALISAACIHDANHEPLFFVGITNDISELEHMRAQLTHSQKMEALGTLVGGVAHEFNNVLTGILGVAELLQSENPSFSKEVVADISMIKSQAMRAAKLVKQLLTFGRKELFNESDLKVTDINTIVIETVKLMRKVIPTTIEITSKISENPCLGRVDVDAVKQVMINLLSNARDSIPSTGDITLLTQKCSSNNCSFGKHKTRFGCACAEDEDRVQVVVEDTGRGISERDLVSIFDPFFTTKSTNEGTGLGLSVVYSIVQQHSGHIGCVSRVNKGTSFIVCLPAAAHVEECPVSRPNSKEVLLASQSSKTVLVVDDEATIRAAVCRQLANLGYTTLTASNGEEGLRQLNDNREDIDLIISDVVMPLMGGDAFVKKTKELGYDLPIILMSGYNHNMFNGSFQKGVHFLQKPFTLNDLYEAILQIEG